MEFEYIESQKPATPSFMYDTIYFQSPDEREEPVEGNWDDEEDEDFDDRVDDLDDLHEIQVGDDLGEPHPDDDDHLPDDDDHLPDDDLQ